MAKANTSEQSEMKREWEMTKCPAVFTHAVNDVTEHGAILSGFFYQGEAWFHIPKAENKDW